MDSKIPRTASVRTLYRTLVAYSGAGVVPGDPVAGDEVLQEERRVLMGVQEYLAAKETVLRCHVAFDVGEAGHAVLCAMGEHQRCQPAHGVANQVEPPNALGCERCQGRFQPATQSRAVGARSFCGGNAGGPPPRRHIGKSQPVRLPRRDLGVASPAYLPRLPRRTRRSLPAGGIQSRSQALCELHPLSAAMVGCGLGVTLVPETSVRRHSGTLAWRALSPRIDLVELSVLSRAGDDEPLVDHFISCSRASEAT